MKLYLKKYPLTHGTRLIKKKAHKIFEKIQKPKIYIFNTNKPQLCM